MYAVEDTSFDTAMLINARNSTTTALPMAQDTYWGSFEEISKYNVSLNYAEKLWLAWYTYMQNDVLATGIMSFVMHEAVYFGRSLPWIIIDAIPWFRRYKIQDVCHYTLESSLRGQKLINYACSKKSQQPTNNGNVRPSSSSPTSPSNSHRSGSSTRYVNTLDSAPPSRSLASGR